MSKKYYYFGEKEIEIDYSKLNPFWYLKRKLIKIYTKNLVSRYFQFLENPKYSHNKGNMFYSKARLMKARIMHYQDRFEAWGDLNIGGCENFAFDEILLKKMTDEMIWMGFTREFRARDNELMLQSKYPNQINFYPIKRQWLNKKQTISENIDWKE